MNSVTFNNTFYKIFKNFQIKNPAKIEKNGKMQQVYWKKKNCIQNDKSFFSLFLKYDL